MSRQEQTPFLTYGMPGDLHDLRRVNRNRILHNIITRGPATRAELSRSTGMSRPTVSVIANELLASGVLMEGDRVSSGGAPGTLLEIARETGVTLVVDLRRVDDVTLATVSPGGEVGRRMHTSVDSEEDVLKCVADFAATVPRHSLIGAAIAVHGFVDPQGAWQRDPTGGLDVSVMDKLRRMLRMDVWPVNATDAITVADLRSSPQGLSAQATLVMRGVALGLLIGGTLLTGSTRPAGDIAHLIVDDAGPLCPDCGRRCLFATVEQLYTDQDTFAVRQHVAALVAAVMAPICAAVELQEIVLALLPQPSAAEVRDLIHEELAQRLLAEQMPQVRLSAQGPDAVLVGAAMLYLHKRLI